MLPLLLLPEMYVPFLDHLIHPLQEIHVEHTMYSLAGRNVNDTGWAGLMETVSGFLLLADGHEDYILTQVIFCSFFVIFLYCKMEDQCVRVLDLLFCLYFGTLQP